MRAVIIAHGTISDFKAVHALIFPNDIIIAADGGALHAQALGVIPHILLGDMDSLGEEKAQSLKESGINVIRYPKEKDYTDSHIALQHAVSLGVKQIILLGAMGTRMDHTLGNLFLPFSEEFKDVEIVIQDETQDIIPLKNNSLLKGQRGETFSLIALEDIKGLYITGAKYPLRDAYVRLGGSLTLSNEFLEESVSISWESGEKILLVRQRK